MKAYAALLDRLSYTPSRNAKLRLLCDYLHATPDPDRGWALASLTDGLPVVIPLRRTVMELIGPRLDVELFRLSRDYVGDTAETVALVWPEPAAMPRQPPRLSEIVAALSIADRAQIGTADRAVGSIDWMQQAAGRCSRC